jgi:membrane associated rhomboid family serine protease
MVPIGAVLILLIIFGSITSVILGGVYLRNRNKERMAILQSGADPNLFKDDYRPARNTSLKLGILFISIAVGIIVGFIVQASYYLPDAVAYFASVFLFGGLGLLITVFVDKKEEVKK